MEHTPTPWTKSASLLDGFEKCICTESGETIAFLDNNDDAKFIVRAVNCHDELVEALKVMVDYFKDTTPTHSMVLYKAEQALAKAEGK